MVTPRVRAATGSSRFRREGPGRVALPGSAAAHHNHNPIPRTPQPRLSAPQAAPALTGRRAAREARSGRSGRAGSGAASAQPWRDSGRRTGVGLCSAADAGRTAGRRGDGAGLGANQLRPQGGAASSGGVCDVPVPPRD